MTLVRRSQRAGTSEQRLLLAEMVYPAVARRQFLTALVDDHPEQVRQAALAPAVWVILPPAVQTQVERHVTLIGTLRAFYEDRASSSRLLYVLESGQERFALHFAANPPRHLQSVSVVGIDGVQVSQAVALASGSTSIEPIAAVALSPTLGEQRTAVIRSIFRMIGLSLILVSMRVRWCTISREKREL